MSKTRIKQKIKEMKGFRNILAHKYGKINDKIVYLFLTENLSDFDKVIVQIEKQLRK